MMRARLTILPLGGLGEIGMNAMLVALGDDAILIDCGILFPDDDTPGVDYIIPDFTALARYKLHGYVITHGHEDHIGALPYALQRKDAPIFASRFTCGLIKHKLDEWGFSYDLTEVSPREHLQLGPFDLEFMRVTHSIPDGLAIAIKTELGNIVHTGDFKIDQTPVGGDKTDLARFAALGEEGVLALLSDSTNSEQEGVSLSETAIGRGLEQVMLRAEKRIFVASFASHIHRLQQVCDISQKLGRKVALIGRSMIHNTKMARDMGLMHAPDDLFVEPLEDLRELTVLTTGSQAEPGSALARLAFGEHQMKITPGDMVIFSSRSIPGNERAISHAMSGLVRQGAEVVYGHAHAVHTSGHAHREEQRLMINLVKPAYFVPIHGELHHLAAHAHTAKTCGVSNCFIVENGQTVCFEKSGNEVLGFLGETVTCGRVMVDGKGVGDVTDVVLRDRQQLAAGGLVICVLSLADLQPDIFMRGISADAPLLDDAKAWVTKALAERTEEARRDRAVVEETVRLALRRFFRRERERKPVIVPVVL